MNLTLGNGICRLGSSISQAETEKCVFSPFTLSSAQKEWKDLKHILRMNRSDVLRIKRGREEIRPSMCRKLVITPSHQERTSQTQHIRALCVHSPAASRLPTAPFWILTLCIWLDKVCIEKSRWKLKWLVQGVANKPGLNVFIPIKMW